MGIFHVGIYFLWRYFLQSFDVRTFQAEKHFIQDIKLHATITEKDCLSRAIAPAMRMRKYSAATIRKYDMATSENDISNNSIQRPITLFELN